jgi:hypothetical protein
VQRPLVLQALQLLLGTMLQLQLQYALELLLGSRFAVVTSQKTRADFLRAILTRCTVR